MTPEDSRDQSQFTRRQFMALAGAAVATGSSLLAGCGSSSTSATTTTTSAGTQPHRGGRLSAGMSDGGSSDTLDANAGSSTCDWARQTALYDRLAEQAPDGSSVPALAESFEHNGDGTLWTVKLRAGVHWHNGKPLTADDVIYTIKRIGAPKSTLDGVSEVAIIDIPSIKKIDNLTLQLPLHKPTADLASFFTIYFMSIIPEGTTSFHHPIGTGPFEFKSFTPGQSSLFTRNPNYWMNGKPYVDELYIESITNPTTRLNALLSGEVDAIESLTFSDAQQQKNSTTIKLLISTADNLVPLTMACDTAPFNDPRVRQAMRLIVDRPALIETAQVGYGAVGNDLYGKGLQLYDNSLPQRVQDLGQAKSLLKKAGHDNLTVTLNTSSVAAGMYESALAFAQQAKGAGVNVQLNNIPASNYFTTNYLKYVFGQTIWTAYPIPQFFIQALVSNAPFNETHWRSPAFDKLFYDAQGDLNTASRQEKFLALQHTLFEDGGYIIWGFQPLIDAVGAHVHPAPQNPAGYLGNYEFREFWID